MSNSNNTSFWPLILVAAVLGALVQIIAGGNDSSPAPTNTNSAEYRYTKERFKQEGFSNSDADTAAKAVLKFHEAQKARNQ